MIMNVVILRRGQQGEESPQDTYLKELPKETLNKMPNKMLIPLGRDSMSRMGGISMTTIKPCHSELVSESDLLHC